MNDTTNETRVGIAVERITQPTCTKTDFGLVDAKGRKIGYRVLTWSEEWTATDLRSGYRCGDVSDLGVWFIAWTSVTRNDSDFGASTASLHARTQDELNALVAKRMAGAKARAAKGGAA